jgi:ATP phosphoribosyltransferase
MLASNGRLKVAVQKDGRISDDSIALLKSMGFDFEVRSRSLFSPCRNFPLDILSVRDDDIPEYVQDGVSDFGIVGENIMVERGSRVEIVDRLGFGNCQLAICAPKTGSIKDLSSLRGARIATSYPRTVKRFLEANRIDASIVEISGSVEITPALNVSDATCDIISTGSTARVNGLEVIHTVMSSEAILIGNPTALLAAEKKQDIGQFILRLRSVLQARDKMYVMMNAPVDAVEKIKALVPGMKSPTVVPLANRNLVAVHSVVAESVIWEVMEKLKAAGASDIIVVPIVKIIS